MILSVFYFNYLSIILNSCLNIIALLDIYVYTLAFIIVLSIGSLVLLSGKISETLVKGIITGAGIAIGKTVTDTILTNIKSGNKSGDDIKSNPQPTTNPDSSSESSTELSSGDK